MPVLDCPSSRPRQPGSPLGAVRRLLAREFGGLARLLDDPPTGEEGETESAEDRAPSDGRVWIPHPLALLRHAGPALAEGVIGPVLLFYIVLLVVGVDGALWAALGFAFAAIGRRLLAGERPSAILLVSAIVLTGRTALALATGSTFVYFLQPTLGTFLVAAAFLLSLRLRRPLAERLTRDFCPLDTSLTARPRIRRFFQHVTLLWTVAFLANASVTLWLLLTASLQTFVLAKLALSPVVEGSAVVLSVLLFRQVLRHEGLRLGFRPLGVDTTAR